MARKTWITVPIFMGFAAVLLSQQPAFEVASVKPSEAGRAVKGGPGRNDPGLFSVRNRPLKSLVQMAYEVQDYQVTGGPSWVETERFDIDAKPAVAASRAEMMVMLRALLAERFQLRVRRESKPVATYVLTVAKGGPKFGPHFRKLGQGEQITTDPNKGLPLGGDMKGFVFLLRRNMQMFDPEKGGGVSAQDTPPVLDQTGLEGDYDIILNINTHEDWAGILEHQLGLKLELRKSPVEMLVIEHAERPSGN